MDIGKYLDPMIHRLGAEAALERNRERERLCVHGQPLRSEMY